MKRTRRRRNGSGPEKWLGLLLCLCGCGGSGTDPTTEAAEILFEGTPAELLPHSVGHTSHFLVTARTDADAISTVVSTTVLSDGPNGEFIVETSSDGGSRRRLRARETEDRIVLEAFTQMETEPEWTELPQPATLVQTPVVAGTTAAITFARTVDVLLDVDGVREARTITFSGSGTRTPRAVEAISFGDDEISAIAFDLRGDGRADDVPGLPPSAAEALRLSFVGTEYRAPGLGLVRETVHLTIAAGRNQALIELRTERRVPEGHGRRGQTPATENGPYARR